MPPTYDTTLKAARMTATRDVVADGTLEILDAGGNVLASFGLSATGGTVTGDTWTLAFETATAPGSAAAGSGTNATAARIKDGSGAVRITGLTVGLTGSGADLEFDNVNIAEGQDVTLTGGTFTHA